MNTETSTIGGLPPGGAITGDELIEVEQNGVSVHVPASALLGQGEGEGGLDKAGLIALITSDPDVKAALLGLATVSVRDLDDVEIARAYPPLPLP